MTKKVCIDLVKMWVFFLSVFYIWSCLNLEMQTSHAWEGQVCDDFVGFTCLGHHNFFFKFSFPISIFDTSDFPITIFLLHGHAA